MPTLACRHCGVGSPAQYRQLDANDRRQKRLFWWTCAPYIAVVGMYVSVRGWLEVDHTQRGAVESVILAAERDLYTGGWGFPQAPFNWSLYVFYGGDIREAELPWLREQVSLIAALQPVDDDGDMPVGLFVVSDERGAVNVWEVSGGTVRDRSAPELAWVFRV